MVAGAIDPFVDGLQTGKIAIGSKTTVVAGLICSLQEGTHIGKMDAATTLFNLVMYGANRKMMVGARVVEVLIDLLADEKAGVTDEALAVLSLLCGCDEGMQATENSRVMASVLVDLIRFGSGKGKEYAILILLGTCRDGGEEMGRWLLTNPMSVPSLHSLVADRSTKARRKDDALLMLLNQICSQFNASI